MADNNLLSTLLQFLGPQAAMRQQSQLPLPGLNVPGAMAGQPVIRPQGMGQGILQQLGGGIQSPAFPFVPPVPQQALGRIGAPAQAAPTGAPTAGIGAGIAPGAPPTTPTPTGRAPTAPTEAKKGLSDQQRQLLAMALQVGLPLLIAGISKGRGVGLAAAGGLAKGFGAAATQRRKLEALKDQPVFTIDPETGQLTQTGTVPKGAKVIKKPKEKEDDITKALEAILGPQPTKPSEAGKPIAEKVQKVTRETLPRGVSEEDIKFTMKEHGLSREEVLKRLR